MPLIGVVGSFSLFMLWERGHVLRGRGSRWRLGMQPEGLPHLTEEMEVGSAIKSTPNIEDCGDPNSRMVDSLCNTLFPPACKYNYKWPRDYGKI